MVTMMMCRPSTFFTCKSTPNIEKYGIRQQSRWTLLIPIRCIAINRTSFTGKCFGRYLKLAQHLQPQLSNLFLFFVFLISQKWFSNRDYVFNRRYFIDRNRKLIIIVNQSADHPMCPKKPNNQRVQDYWSYMVIQPTSNSFKTPGLEYTLTYFDNPGIVLPQTVIAWVAHKQMPEFLNKLHLATVEYAKSRIEDDIATEEVVRSSQTYLTRFFKPVFVLLQRNDGFTVPDPGYEYPPEPEVKFQYCRRDGSDADDVDDDDDDDMADNKRGKDRNLNNNRSTSFTEQHSFDRKYNKTVHVMQ